MSLLKKGSRGNAVKDLQRQLNSRGYKAGNVDGIFGNKTYNAVKAFQKANGLKVDGIVGSETRAKLQSGGITRELQTILNQVGIDVGKIDGIVGPDTKKGIREFQRIFGLKVDGIPGKNTWNVLNKAKNVKHFKVREFRCKHCGEIKLDIDLLVKLEEVRRRIGDKPIIITSGYRCPTHNACVGGAKNSQHKYGRAADIRANDISVKEMNQICDEVFKNGGVGLHGTTITHVDTRGYRARWYYN